MTFREKLEKEQHGVNIAEAITNDCPSDYGYESYTPRCPMGREQDCSVCWDREIPETNLVIGDSEVEHPDTDIPEKKMIYAHIGSDLETVDPKEVRETYKHVKEGKMTVNEMRETLGLPKILDSGNRRQFESGAVRDIQEGKGRCDLLPLDVVADIPTDLYGEIDGVLFAIAKFQETGDIKHLYVALTTFNATYDVFKDRSTMLLEVSKHFEEGAKKYGENNWQKGIPVHCYIDSAVRHYLKFLRGDKDEPHDRAFAWNIMCAIWTCKHKPELNEYVVKEEV